MFSLLLKLYVKDYGNINSPEIRTKYGVLGGALGIGLNIFLFAFKCLAGILSGSIAVLADAVNNLSDAGSSLISLLGFRLASQKPDEDHPFGHGRVEYVSAFVVSMLIILMGIEIGKASVDKILNPSEAEVNLIAAIILAVSILVKFYMYAYNTKYGKLIDSSVMKATAVDSLSDAVSTAVVLLSMAILHFFDINADGWCGVVVAVFILKSGIDAAKDTFDDLLGKPPSEEFIKQIEDIVLAHEEVISIHDLIIHDYGPGRRMISLHGEVSAEGNILELHDKIDNIEKELKAKLNCDAVIHMDPIEMDNELVSEMREKVVKVINSIDERISIHDFRVVTGKTHNNVIFDVVVPYGITMSDREIKKKISEKVHSEYGNVFCVIEIDRPYSVRG